MGEAEPASLDIISVFLLRELPMLIFLLSELAFLFRVEGFAAAEAITADALVVLNDTAFFDPVFAVFVVASFSFSVPISSSSRSFFPFESDCGIVLLEVGDRGWLAPSLFFVVVSAAAAAAAADIVV
jgi:hypothetical protein